MSNGDILLKALKDFGGSADKMQLYWFMHDHSRDYPRRGRSWAIDRVQHDMFYLCEDGRVMMVKDGPDHFTYYLSEQELWKN